MSEPPVILRPGEETYLGHGVYVSLDGVYQIWLRDDRDEHRIVLAPETFAELVRYVRAIRAQLEAAYTPDAPETK